MASTKRGSRALLGIRLGSSGEAEAALMERLGETGAAVLLRAGRFMMGFIEIHQKAKEWLPKTSKVRKNLEDLLPRLDELSPLMQDPQAATDWGECFADFRASLVRMMEELGKLETFSRRTKGQGNNPAARLAHAPKEHFAYFLSGCALHHRLEPPTANDFMLLAVAVGLDDPLELDPGAVETFEQLEEEFRSGKLKESQYKNRQSYLLAGPTLGAIERQRDWVDVLGRVERGWAKTWPAYKPFVERYCPAAQPAARPDARGAASTPRLD